MVLVAHFRHLPVILVAGALAGTGSDVWQADELGNTRDRHADVPGGHRSGGDTGQCRGRCPRDEHQWLESHR